MDKQKTSVSFTFDSVQVFWFLAALICSSLVVRLMVGYTQVHFFDLSYYVDWSAGAAKDLFGAYENVENLDYPPLFLFPLFFTGKLMESSAVSAFEPYQMLVLKGWQILFDVAMIALLYLVLRRLSPLFALGAASLWAINPTMLYNSSCWGQTDSIMMALLVLAFWLLTTQRPVWAGVVMTLACLMKFQSLYFVPLFALALLTTVSWKKILQTIGAGLSVAFAVFFPFMLRSGWLLPWEVYFGGFEQYQSASLNAFNLYGAAGLNYQSADNMLFGKITAEQFSTVMIGIALVMLLFFYFTATEKSVWLLGLLFMQTIFLFTTRMHERYQIPVLIFALIASVYHKSKGLFFSYLALTLMTFLNHFFVLEEIFTGDKSVAWVAEYDRIVIAMSALNLVLYVLVLAIGLRILYGHGYFRFWHGVRGIFAGGWRDVTVQDVQTDDHCK